MIQYLDVYTYMLSLLDLSVGLLVGIQLSQQQICIHACARCG